MKDNKKNPPLLATLKKQFFTKIIPSIKSSFTKRWLKTTVLIICALILLSLSYLRTFERFELLTYDLRFKLRPPLKTSDDIAIIEIGNKSLTQLGRWPFDRSFHAALIDILSEVGAKYVVFDILFSEPSDSDIEMVKSTQINPIVYYSYAFRIPDKIETNIVEALWIDSPLVDSIKNVCQNRLGHINARAGIDGKRRKLPIVIKYQDKYHPYLSLKVAQDYFKIPDNQFQVVPCKYIRLGKKKLPIDENGYFLINYADTWMNSFKHFSYFDILKSYQLAAEGKEPIIDLSQLKDKVCFVGLTATATHDINPTPLESKYPMLGLHANILNSIIYDKYLFRLNRLSNILILILLSSILVVLIIKRKPLISLGLTLLIILIYMLFALGVFIFFGAWIDLFYPIAVLLLLYVCITLFKFLIEQRTRLLIEKEFSIAQRIQFSFLPQEALQKEKVEIATELKTAKAVGGDLYDYVDFNEVNPDLAGIFIGDVSGKGMPAALYMAMTIAHFRVSAKGNTSVKQTLTDLNEKLMTQSRTGLFVTAFYMIYDCKTRKLNYSNGGHLPALLYKAKEDKVVPLTTEEGSLLGLIEGIEFGEGSVVLSEGDIVLLFTDGVEEARNIKKQEFGEDAIKTALMKYKKLSAVDITKSFRKDIIKFAGKAAQHDDFTIIALKVA